MAAATKEKETNVSEDTAKEDSTEEKKDRAPRLSAEEILRRRGDIIKLAKASTKDFPTIVEDVEWALSYCPKGTYSVGTRTPAVCGTEAGYRRMKDDQRRRKEAGLTPDEPHDIFWPSPCEPCEKAHQEHLAEMKKKREVADKQRKAINAHCLKWRRENRGEALDLVMEAEEILSDAGGELAAGSFRGFPTLGDNDSALEGTKIPTNVMMAWLVTREESASLSRGVWKATDEISIDAFEEVVDD